MIEGGDPLQFPFLFGQVDPGLLKFRLILIVAELDQPLTFGNALAVLELEPHDQFGRIGSNVDRLFRQPGPDSFDPALDDGSFHFGHFHSGDFRPSADGVDGTLGPGFHIKQNHAAEDRAADQDFTETEEKSLHFHILIHSRLII